MSRPPKPESQYTVKPHNVGGHVYASTQPWEIDTSSGRKKYRYVHWGTVADGVFYPNARYISASADEKTRLVFPREWDMRNAGNCAVKDGRGRPAYSGEPANRLYGHIWLLEQVAEKTGVRHDLDIVFDGDRQKTDIVLTLAMFPYLTKYTYNRLERWQRTDRAPYDLPLSSGDITTFTQSLGEKHRMALLGLRAGRLGRDELCCVDSTTRSAFGDALADICWGKNKEHLPLPQTTEVVVYTVSQHMPVYYRTFPGNMNDSRSLRTVMADMDHAGFPDVVFITDRGYQSLRNLEEMIRKERKTVMCTKTSLGLVSDRIKALGDFGVRPDGMEVDTELKLYMAQYRLDYSVKGNGSSVKSADRLRLNLYFDPVRRSAEHVALDVSLKESRDELARMVAAKETVDSIAQLKREFPMFTLDVDEEKRVLKGFEEDSEKVASARRLSGFVALVTLGLDWTPGETIRHYMLRDEQEKYFEQMKDQMGADRQRNWSGEGKTGRLFVLFVSLILGSYVRHVWKTTDLCRTFSSSLEILDEMRPIRCIEHPGRARVITPFLKRQLEICEAFGFTPPKNCDKVYKSRQVSSGKKRGRPRKQPVVSDL